MKTKFIHIYSSYIICVAFFFSSCNKEPKESPLFLQIDSLIKVQPDSTLQMLRNIPIEELANPKDYADYALLVTKAKDANRIIHTSDSLIRIAVDYYQDTRNKKKKRQAYFYLGRVYRDMEMSTTAIEAFQQALEISGKTKDRLTSLIYSNLSFLYQEQGFYEKAIEMINQAYEISVQTNNVYDKASFSRELGLILRYANQPDSALHYYKEALKSAQAISEKRLESFILSDMAHLYGQQGKLDSAYWYIEEAREAAPDQQIVTSMFFVTGRVFHQLGDMDSARNYLLPLLNNHDIYTRAASRLELSAIEEKAGDIQKAFKYNREYLSLKDSIDSRIRRREAAILLNEHAIKVEAEKITRDKLKLAGFIIVTLGFLILFINMLYRNRKHKREAVVEPLPNMEAVSKEVQVLSQSLNSQGKKIKSSLAALQKEPSYPLVEKVHNSKEPENIHLTIEERETLKEIFLKTFSDVGKELALTFPKLTPDELYCCILYLSGCSSPEVKVILCIENGALRVKRTRIRKKIDPIIYDLIFSDK
ncbi:lipopolysaccharide assembly protein LapB [Bacteroides sp. 224]|uniref:tetratricopeptide repeat protein n=1 Tax=Bacteroides sp. 224 TaxID=2302936 RepID=UPI0013D54DE9|nr:tetratricopeptide repeat protein [Bacteroides sp. 224]NDV66286.1 tetratricopeptide repeat protein [Bacteroides sp. 224]